MKGQYFLILLGFATMAACELGLVRKHAFQGEVEPSEDITNSESVASSSSPELSLGLVRKTSAFEQIDISHGRTGSTPTLETPQRERMEVHANGLIETPADVGDKATSLARVFELGSELHGYEQRVHDLLAELEYVKKSCAKNDVITLPHGLMEGKIDDAKTETVEGKSHQMVSKSVRWEATQEHVKVYYGGSYDLLETDLYLNRKSRLEPMEFDAAELFPGKGTEHMQPVAATLTLTARLAGQNHSRKKIGFERKLFPERSEILGLRSQVRSGTMTAHSKELTTLAADQLYLSSKSDWALHEPVRHAMQKNSFGSKSFNDRGVPANNSQKDAQAKPNLALQFRSGFMSMLMFSRQKGFELILLMLLICAFTCLIRRLEEKWKQRKRDHALLELRSAAQEATQHALLLQEDNGWRGTLIKLRELREGSFNKNHPFYRMLEAHMEMPETQTQLQSLFSELSEGKTLMTVEQLLVMFTSLVADCTNLTTGRLLRSGPISSVYYMWLIDAIQQPLTCCMFVSIFALFWGVWTQVCIIQGRGDGTTQAATGDVAFPCRIVYRVEINGHVACSASFDAGNFQRLGSSLYLDREVHARPYEIT